MIFLGFGPFSAISWEPVVHSLKWTTGSELFLAFGLVSLIPLELVVYSPKWATGSTLFLDSGPFSAFSLGASGPLFKVGHWLGAFSGFRLVSGLFSGASGPLDGVDHWRGTLPRFWLGFGGYLERFLSIVVAYLRGFAG